MNIGTVTYDFDPAIGGLGHNVKDLLKSLRGVFPADSYAVHSPSGATANASVLARWWWKKPGGCPMFSLTLLWTLPQFVKAHSIDLLHIHSGSGGVFLLRKPKIRLVTTSHHTYRQEAELVYGHRPIKRFLKHCMACLERRTYEYADRIICVSADTRCELIQHYGIPAHKLTVIENGIDLDVFTPKQQCLKDGNTITYLGRLEERKGIWVLLKAFARLKKKHPALKLRLVGGDLLGEALQSFLVDNALTDAVTLRGHVDRDEFIREMQQATLIVVPSLIEGFGLIAAEAMAAGTFVVASASDGLKHIISQRETGLLFKVGDSDSCAESIEEALGSPDLRKLCEQRALKEATERFSIIRQARETHAVYEELSALTA